MFWAVVSFICSTHGCLSLPRMDFKPQGTAEQCVELRNAIVQPNKPRGRVWVEAYCTAIGGRYP